MRRLTVERGIVEISEDSDALGRQPLSSVQDLVDPPTTPRTPLRLGDQFPAGKGLGKGF